MFSPFEGHTRTVALNQRTAQGYQHALHLGKDNIFQDRTCENRLECFLMLAVHTFMLSFFAITSIFVEPRFLFFATVVFPLKMKNVFKVKNNEYLYCLIY